MAAMASASVAIEFQSTLVSTVRHYALAPKGTGASSLTPSESWATVEPAYEEGKSLFFADAQTWTTNTGTKARWSPVSLSSSYTASSEAMNRADQAISAAAEGSQYFYHDDAGAHIVSDKPADATSWHRLDATSNGLDLSKVLTDGTETSVASFAANGSRIGTPTGERFEQRSDSLKAYDSGNSMYFSVSKDGMRFGAGLDAAAKSEDIANLDGQINGTVDEETGELKGGLANEIDDLNGSIFGTTVVEGDVETHVPGAIDAINDSIAGVSDNLSKAVADLGSDISSVSGKADAMNTELSDKIAGIAKTANGSVEDIKGLNKSLGEVNEALGPVTSFVGSVGSWFSLDDDALMFFRHNTDDDVSVMRLTAADLGFYVRRNGKLDASPVAAIVAGKDASESALLIGNAEIDQSMRFGGFRWKRRANGNMALMWEE